MKYNRLRTLKLNSPRVEELPSAIGKLKHLRYLDLSHSSIRKLPRTFCCLCNLQILDLTFCTKLKNLPKNIRYMTTLRHIFLESCYSLSRMPYKIGELVSLKTLSLFIVDNRIGNRLDELEHLNLGGRLTIKHLENVQNHMNAKRANLVGKPNLSDLWLEWEGDNRSSELAKMMDDEKVLEALEPHLNLPKLLIIGFKGQGLALWMKNITSISLFECRNITHLRPLGDLPLLKSLRIYDLDALEYIEIRDENSVEAKFPSLESLPNLKGLLKEEEVGEMFPNLGTLTIEMCPLLKVASTFVSSALKSLKNVSCSPLILASFSCKIEHLSSLELDFGEIDHTTITACSNMAEDALQGLCKLAIWRVDNAWQNRLLLIWNCRGEFVDMVDEIKHLQFLKRITLMYVRDMVSLPQGLQHIPSLQSLRLLGLERLTSLPDWLPNLVSLTHVKCK